MASFARSIGIGVTHEPILDQIGPGAAIAVLSRRPHGAGPFPGSHWRKPRPLTCFLRRFGYFRHKRPKMPLMASRSS
jgi:hypothetical protein